MCRVLVVCLTYNEDEQFNVYKSVDVMFGLEVDNQELWQVGISTV